jgi:uncharacterized protein (DUF305 family)
MNSMMHQAKLLALLLGAALLFTGCDSNDMEDDDNPMIPQNDLEFIDEMGPHHMMATQMADMVIQRGSRADVKAFAQQMKDAQTAEINQMKAARQELASSSEIPMKMDEHMEADMEQMQNMSGEALDMMFLEDMLPHHAGAIQMAHNALPNLQRSDMRALAQKIIDDQAKEIQEIRAMMGEE